MSDRRRYLLRRIAERRQELLDRREAGLLSRIDKVIREAWTNVFSAVTRGGRVAVDAARKAMAGLPDRLKFVIGDALAGMHNYAFTGTVTDIVEKLTEKDRANLVRSAINRGIITPTSPGVPPPFTVPSVAETVGVVFPPPPAAVVDAIVYAGNWSDRIAKITKLADPDQVAAAVSRSYTNGTPPSALAKELRPILQNVQSSVRRVVRTEGARVSQTGRLQAYEGLGDLVIGYQIHAVRDSRTRPEHAKRDGYLYYKNPRPGQRGYDVMPRPPLEADGSPAYNCRCFLTPILRPPMEIPALPG